MAAQLSQPAWKHLQNEAVMQFRTGYRNFRRGNAKGSHGEVHDCLVAAASKGAGGRVPGPMLFDLRDDEILGSDEAVMEEVQHLVNEFRMGYRRFRTGGADGGRGSMKRLRAVLEVPGAPHIRLLPAARLAEARRQDRSFRRGITPPVYMRPAFHVHFGAGRLGLGLVVPAICHGGMPFALVNPPFAEFNGIVERHAGREAVLVVNDKVVSPPLRVVTQASHVPGDTANQLVISNDEGLLAPLLQRATTFSTSVGPGMPATAKSLLACLPREEAPTRALFACENDHAGVERMRAAVADRVLVSSCMVDRICVSRDLVDAATPAELRTCTEPYTGCLMVRPLPPGSPEVPFKGGAVLQPNTMAQADYLERRKLVTVNGMHTTLAFMSLVRHCRETGVEVQLCEDKLQEPLDALPLQTMATLDAAAQREVLAWAAARQLFLVFEFGVDFVMLAHDVPEDLGARAREARLSDVMWEYASAIVHRFSSASDTCGRILGGGAVNRWRTRLKPVDTFLRENGSLGRMASALAAKAGVDVAFMRDCAARLCDESEKLMHGPMTTHEISRLELAR